MYKRIVLKISGEALADEKRFGISQKAIDDLVCQLKYLNEKGIEMGVVVGGGNFWRGRQAPNMDKSVADHMGMLATVLNALALQDALEAKGVPVRVQTSLEIRQVAEPFILRKALRHLEKGRIVIFACGTGNPYFTTDTAAALRAAELHADCLLCAKSSDGIYDSDPKVNKEAKRFLEISYVDFISKGLKAMDLTAVSMCMEHNIPVLVFGKDEHNSIIDAVEGKKIGTIIK